MVDYSRAELLNELSKIFRGQVSPQRSGGLSDPQAIHSQLVEIAKTVFLLNPGALFYLARIVRNSALVLVRQEVLLIEDMLIALDDLTSAQRNTGTNIGEVGPTDLANARTALLALEFSDSVVGRPELVRFQKIMDRFSARFRPNMVNTQGRQVLSRGKAREVLREDFEKLKGLHARVLAMIDNIVGLVDEYNGLDLPSGVSQTALVNIRQQLALLDQSISESTEEQLITDSRLIVLRSLASKVVTSLLAQLGSVSVTGPFLTSDNTGPGADPRAPSTGPFLARAVGEGTSAAVETTAGPWRLDELTTGTIDLEVDGVAQPSIDLSVVQGPGLHGKNAAPFTDAQLYPVWPGPPANIAPYSGGAGDPSPPPKEDFLPKANLHLLVDKNSYEFTSGAFGYVDNANVFSGPISKDTVPSLTIPDNSLSLESPRVYPPEGAIGNVSGTPYELISDYYNAVAMTPARKLGFKHLGTQVFFGLGEVPPGTPGPAQAGAGFGGWDVDGQDTLEDQGEWEEIEDRRWDYLFRPRSIFDLTWLASITISHVSGNTYSAAPGTFKQEWVGFYVRIGGVVAADWERYEIISVTAAGDEAVIDTRSDTPGDAAGTVDVFGSRGDYTQITFFPDLLADTDKVADTARSPLTIPGTCTVQIAPSIKTTNVPSGAGATIASTIAALSSPANGAYDTVGNKYQHASYHCIFKEQSGFNGKITIQSRTRFIQDDGHLLQIAQIFFRTDMFLPPFGAGVGSATGQSGTSGSAIGVASPLLILELLGGTFGAANVHNYIQVSGAATLLNNGNFLIIAAGTDGGLPFVNQVAVLNPNGVSPDANDGSIDWIELGKGEGHRSAIPGPNPIVRVYESGHEVFGFAVGQRVDSRVDSFLSPEELLALLEDQLESDFATAEIVETDVTAGLATVLATTFLVEDLSVDFSDIGTSLGYQIELQEGDNAGIYFVESASGNQVQVARPPGKHSTGFVGTEANVPYRLFTQKIRISSKTEGSGSSVEIKGWPDQFGVVPGLVHGTAPAIEAVDSAGNVLDLSTLSPGDTADSLVVESVSGDGTQAVIAGGVSADLVDHRFVFESATANALAAMAEDLQTLKQSRDLLSKFNFDQNLDRIDVALSAVVTPGQVFQANVGQARSLLAHLLGAMTSAPPSAAFYTAQIPQLTVSMDETLSLYTAPQVPPVDALFDALRIHNYDRALALLVTGQLALFFDTTQETASYAGNLMAATRAVAGDVPQGGILQEDVGDTISQPESEEYTVDFDEEFDTEDLGGL